MPNKTNLVGRHDLNVFLLFTLIEMEAVSVI